jgi:hypothetical protein
MKMFVTIGNNLNVEYVVHHKELVSMKIIDRKNAQEEMAEKR